MKSNEPVLSSIWDFDDVTEVEQRPHLSLVIPNQETEEDITRVMDPSEDPLLSFKKEGHVFFSVSWKATLKNYFHEVQKRAQAQRDFNRAVHANAPYHRLLTYLSLVQERVQADRLQSRTAHPDAPIHGILHLLHRLKNHCLRNLRAP